MAPASNHPVGKAFIVYGTVKAISPAGVERILAPNSPVYADDRIVTGADGSISIILADHHGHLDLGRMSDVLLDQDVYDGGGHEGGGDTVAQAEDIQAALQDGDFDPTTGLPAPAAGPGVAGAMGARGGGRQIVVFDAENREVLPDSGAETIGVKFNFLDPPPGGITESESDTTPTVGHAELLVSEANLQDGSSPDATALIKGGTLADLGVHFDADAPGTLDFGGEKIIINGTDASIVIKGTYGNLTVNSNGTWSYTLTDNTHDHTIPGGTGFADQVYDHFNFAAIDSDGSRTDGGSVLVRILDDGPSLSVSDQQVDESGGFDKVDGNLDFGYGADGAGSLALSSAGATWDASHNTLTGADGAWTLLVNNDGTYTFTQLKALSHPDGSDSNDSLPIKVTATVTDGDGDSVSKGITITVHDDGPLAGTPPDAILANESGNHVTGSLDVVFGSDGPAHSLSLLLENAHGASLVGVPVVDDHGNSLTSGNQALVYEHDDNGGVNAVIVGTHDVVFSISLDDVSGTYSVTMGTHPLDVIYKETSFDASVKDLNGAGGSDFNTAAEFVISNDTKIHVSATVTDGHDPISGYVQWNDGGIGVSSDGHTEKNINYGDTLSFDFQSTNGGSQPVESVDFTLVGLGQKSVNGVYIAEQAHYTTYLDGKVVDQGTVYGEADGQVDFHLQSSGAFDSIKFEAATKSTAYQISDITVGEDPVLSYSVHVTDGDGDTAQTGTFHVTFDTDGNITGSDHNEIISGSSSEDIIKGSGGDDVLDGGAGKDSITGGAGSDTFLVTEHDNDEVHDFVGTSDTSSQLDHLIDSGSTH